MSNADDVGRDVLALPAKLVAAGHAVVVTYGGVLQAAVQRHASAPRTSPRPLAGGTEGPRALTGAYRRSHGRRTVKRVMSSTTTVGTNDVRGRALEFGNPDAFGGTRATLPYPHFAPALDETEAPFAAALGAAVAEAVREDSEP